MNRITVTFYDKIKESTCASEWEIFGLIKKKKIGSP